MTTKPSRFSGPIARFVGRLRFPYLFLLTATLFVVDLFVPDLVPFADEILLAGVTALLGSWKRRRGSGNGKPAAKNNGGTAAEE